MCYVFEVSGNAPSKMRLVVAQKMKLVMSLHWQRGSDQMAHVFRTDYFHLIPNHLALAHPSRTSLIVQNCKRLLELAASAASLTTKSFIPASRINPDIGKVGC